MLTACGIETLEHLLPSSWTQLLQQCLPLAVLKPIGVIGRVIKPIGCNSAYRLRYWNFVWRERLAFRLLQVATVLTACGIETVRRPPAGKTPYKSLQQCLPLAVLKPWPFDLVHGFFVVLLQQCLPLAVLKRKIFYITICCFIVATVLTACGIETSCGVLFNISPL